MNTTTHRVTVANGIDWATAHWSDIDGDAAEVSMSNGGTMRMSANCLELLYEALHEMFGSK